MLQSPEINFVSVRIFDALDWSVNFKLGHACLDDIIFDIFKEKTSFDVNS